MAGPGIWNSLPTDIRENDVSVSRFKSMLKTVLFAAAFNVGQ